MNIQSVTVENFKGVENGTFNVPKGLTVVGANAHDAQYGGLMNAIEFGFGANERNFEFGSFAEFVKTRPSTFEVSLEISSEDETTKKMFRRKYEDIGSKCFYEVDGIIMSRRRYIYEFRKLAAIDEGVPLPMSSMHGHLGNSAALGFYFDRLSGSAEIVQDLVNLRKDLTGTIHRQRTYAAEQTSLLKEREMTLELYLTKILLYETQAKSFEPKIQEAEQNHGHLSPQVLRLRTKQNEYLEKRLFMLRQAQINNVELPLLAGTLNVLTPEEIEDLKNLFDASTVYEKTSFDIREVAEANLIKLDFSSLGSSITELSENLENSLRTICGLLDYSLNDCRVDQKQLDLTLPLFRREAIINNHIARLVDKQNRIQKEIQETEHHRRQRFGLLSNSVGRTIKQEWDTIVGLQNGNPTLRAVDENFPWDGLVYTVPTADSGDTEFGRLPRREAKLAELALKFSIISATGPPIILLKDVVGGDDDTVFLQIVSFLKSQSSQVIVTATDPAFFKALEISGHSHTIIGNNSYLD